MEKIKDINKLDEICKYCYSKQLNPKTRCFYYRENYDEYYKIMKNSFKNSSIYIERDNDGKLNVVIIVENASDSITQIDGIFFEEDNKNTCKEMFEKIIEENNLDKIDIVIDKENKDLEEMLHDFGLKSVNIEYNLSILKDDLLKLKENNGLHNFNFERVLVNAENIEKYESFIEKAFLTAIRILKEYGKIYLYFIYMFI